MSNYMNSRNLTWYEHLGKEFLDNWVSPICAAIPDLECLEPRIRKRTVALDIPGVTQVHTYSCGATASWSILRALGWRISLRRWIGICHDHGMHPDEGMDEHQLDTALRRISACLKTLRYRSKAQVVSSIDAGQPLLFGWDDNGAGEGDHWMYVYGYERRHVLVGNIVCPGRSKGRVKWGEWSDRLTPREIHQICAIS